MAMRSLLLVVAMAVCAWTAPAAAATITVNTTDDEVNSDGDCSLREAVRAANGNAVVDGCTAGTSGLDTIVVPSGTFALTESGTEEQDALTGDLDITGTVAIQGAGQSSTIIDGNATDRVFHVLNSTAGFSDLTIQNGKLWGADDGGGMLAVNSTVTIADCTLQDNEGALGGGIAVKDGGSLTMQDTTVSANAAGQGAGLAVSGADASITDSTITGNAATAGTGFGGGLFAHSDTLDFSVSVTGSLFSANSAGYGGGLDVGDHATVSLTNTTVTGNSATAKGGGASLRAGATGSVTFANVTIASNTADSDTSGSDGAGGGIYRGAGTSTVTVGNSLFGDNATNSGSGPDCSGSLTSQGYNLIESTTACSIGGTTTGNLTGDASLDPLADNGGATQTRALGTGSQAINAGNPATPGSGGTACELLDQRGLWRGGTRCDIGAFEVGATVTTTTVTTTTTTITTTTTTSTTTTTTSTSTTSTSLPGPTTTSTTIVTTTSTTGPPATTTTTTVPAGDCVSIAAPVLVVTKIGGTVGDEALVLRGRLGFTADSAPGFSASASGLQLLVEDGAGTRLWDLTATSGRPVPPGAPGHGCGPKDGWKGATYKNGSNAVAPPACPAGSAQGLKVLKVSDKRSGGRGIGMLARARGAAVATPSGGVRLTVSLGAEEGGPCATHTFDAARCKLKRTRLICR